MLGKSYLPLLICLLVQCYGDGVLFAQAKSVGSASLQGTDNIIPLDLDNEMFTGLLRKELHMHLLTLQTLIPKMEKLRDEILPLTKNPESTLESESEMVDFQMMWLGQQFWSSGERVQRVASLRDQLKDLVDTRHHLLANVTTLQDIHGKVLSEVVPNVQEKVGALKPLLNQVPFPGDQILELIRQEESQMVKNALLWKLLQSLPLQTDALDGSDFLIQIGQIILDEGYEYLNYDLHLPTAVMKLFSGVPTGLQSDQTGRVLVLDANRNVITRTYAEQIPTKWIFISSGDGQIFQIQDKLSGLAIGSQPLNSNHEPEPYYTEGGFTVEDYTTLASVFEESNSTDLDEVQGKENPGLPEVLPPDDHRRLDDFGYGSRRSKLLVGEGSAMREDPHYLWKVVTVLGQKKELRLKFINVATDLVVDANSHGEAYSHLTNEDGYQNWDLI